jgi:hypothetical protein
MLINNILMPIINQVYNYEEDYDGDDWESPLIDVSNGASVQFIVYSSVNCTMSLNWTTNIDTQEIIYEDVETVLGGTSNIIQVPIRTKYVIFKVINFASNPVDLFNSSGFFFLT